MASLERTYVVPLRKEYQKVATYKRTKKATKAVKEFVVRHMKAVDFNAVKILNELNVELWKHGIRNPPHKIKIVCRRDDKGVVMVQLFGQAFPEAPKAEEKKGAAAKLAEKVGAAAGKVGSAVVDKVKAKDEHEGHDHAHDHAGHDHGDHKHEEPKKEEKKPKAPVPKPAPGHTPPQNQPTPVRKNPEQKR
jgi:ribosomal protein L31E